MFAPHPLFATSATDHGGGRRSAPISLQSAQSREIGVTLEILVAKAEQDRLRREGSLARRQRRRSAGQPRLLRSGSHQRRCRVGRS